MMTELPQPQGLYDPRNEHDACGVGFVVVGPLTPSRFDLWVTNTNARVLVTVTCDGRPVENAWLRVSGKDGAMTHCGTGTDGTTEILLLPETDWELRVTGDGIVDETLSIRSPLAVAFTPG